jgi:hypothetical protein
MHGLTKEKATNFHCQECCLFHFLSSKLHPSRKNIQILHDMFDIFLVLFFGDNIQIVGYRPTATGKIESESKTLQEAKINQSRPAPGKCYGEAEIYTGNLPEIVHHVLEKTAASGGFRCSISSSRGGGTARSPLTAVLQLQVTAAQKRGLNHKKRTDADSSTSTKNAGSGSRYGYVSFWAFHMWICNY